MGAFGNLSSALKKIDVYQILTDITRQSDVQRWVSDTIKGRIQKTGIGADGNKFQTDSSSSGESYSDVTIGLKEKYGVGIGAIDDHVTFYNHGDFWGSLKIIIIQHGFRTEADFNKKDGHMWMNFLQDYGSKEDFENAVLGMNENEIDRLVSNYYYPRFIKKLNEILR